MVPAAKQNCIHKLINKAATSETEKNIQIRLFPVLRRNKNIKLFNSFLILIAGFNYKSCAVGCTQCKRQKSQEKPEHICHVCVLHIVLPVFYPAQTSVS